MLTFRWNSEPKRYGSLISAWNEIANIQAVKAVHYFVVFRGTISSEEMPSTTPFLWDMAKNWCHGLSETETLAHRWKQLGNFTWRPWKIHCMNTKMLFFVWLRSSDITTVLKLVVLWIQELLNSCDGKSIVLQVDFSTIAAQKEVQVEHW